MGTTIKIGDRVFVARVPIIKPRFGAITKRAQHRFVVKESTTDPFIVAEPWVRKR